MLRHINKPCIINNMSYTEDTSSDEEYSFDDDFNFLIQNSNNIANMSSANIISINNVQSQLHNFNQIIVSSDNTVCDFTDILDKVFSHTLHDINTTGKGEFGRKLLNIIDAYEFKIV